MHSQFPFHSNPTTRALAGLAVVVSGLALSLSTAPRPAKAAGWVVNTLTDAANGNCNTTCTLRDAMSLAASGDTITFSVSGTIFLNANLPPIAKSLTIDGIGQSIAIDGQNNAGIGSIFVVSTAGITLNLSNLTIQHAVAGSATSNQGGGLYINAASTVNIANCTFASDQAVNTQLGLGGGAIAIYSGGAIVNINNSTFSANSASAGGGAIDSVIGQLNIANSTFSANSTANEGGGAILGNGNIANSTFSGNSANGTTSSTGGAIFSANQMNITNSTFSGNSAIVGGAVFSHEITTLNNNIFTKSSGGDCVPQVNGGLINGANNLSDGSCSGTFAVVTGVAATLASNGGPTQTFALLGGSNAIDAVPNGACVYVSNGTNPLFTNGAAITTDQRGISRPQGSLCDIGSYEAVLPAMTATPTNTPTATLTPTPIPVHIDTIGVFRPSGRTFYLRLHNSSGNADITVGFGPGTTPYPVVGDWTGAGFDTVGTIDQSSGVFTLCTANDTATCANNANLITISALGQPNDLPLSGRWRSYSTYSSIGVFRPSNGLTYLKQTLTTGFADYTMVLGIPGDVGLAGDWNGDYVDSPGVFRPSNGNFYLSNDVCNCSVNPDIQFQYGVSGDAPVMGDWIAQGHDGVGLFRRSSGYTYLRNELTTGNADIAFVYGIGGDIPVAGHWQVAPPPTSTPTSTDTPTFTDTPTVTNTPTATASNTSTSTPTSTPIPPRIDSIGVFRTGTFLLRLHNSTGNADIAVAFSHGTKPYPVVGDWAGAGFDTVGVYDQSNGQFTLCTANNTTTCANSANVIQFVLGTPNDQPIAGRWNAAFNHFGGGVFRPSNGLIYLRNNLTSGFADYTMVLGIPGDVGLGGDWNGDGLDSLGVYRPGNSTFYANDQTCNCSLIGTYQFAYGLGGDAPVVGDWIGQGHDGVGLFRRTNGYTYLRNSLTTGFADIAFVYGIAGDVPVAGHWQAVYPPVAEYRAGQAAAPTQPTGVGD